MKSLGFEEYAGLDLAELKRHGRLVAAQHHAIQQVVHTVECGAPAEDLQFLDGFPAQERAEQTAQAQDVVEVPVRQQHARQVPEAHAGLQDLPLGALAAIDQKAIFVVLDDQRGKPRLAEGAEAEVPRKRISNNAVSLYGPK